MMTTQSPPPRSAFRTSYRAFLTSLNRALRDAGIQPNAGFTVSIAGSPAADEAADKPVVGKVQTFIDQHLSADLTVDRLADVADLSPLSLGRRFKAAADTTPWRYVVERRIEAAKRLLEETDRSIAAIAVDTGFYDQAHLTRTFKRLEGETPGAYRDEVDE